MNKENIKNFLRLYFISHFKIKKILFLYVTSLAFFSLLFQQGAIAGSEGKIIMTYYFDSPLDKELEVTINTSLDHGCMYDYEIKGTKTFKIPSGTIGLHELNASNPIYYEAKASSTGGDTCAADPSYFHVEVKANDSRYSFTSPFQVKTGNFFTPNKSKLYFRGDDPANQSICAGRSYCKNTSYSYHYTHTPTLHTIYRPTY